MESKGVDKMNNLLLRSDFTFDMLSVNTEAYEEWYKENEVEEKLNNWELSRDAFLTIVSDVVVSVTDLSVDEFEDMVKRDVVDEDYLDSLHDELMECCTVDEEEHVSHVHMLMKKYCKRAYATDLYMSYVESEVNKFLIDGFINELNKLSPNSAIPRYTEETSNTGIYSIVSLDAEALDLIRSTTVMYEICDRVRSGLLVEFSDLFDNSESMNKLSLNTTVRENLKLSKVDLEDAGVGSSVVVSLQFK